VSEYKARVPPWACRPPSCYRQLAWIELETGPNCTPGFFSGRSWGRGRPGPSGFSRDRRYRPTRGRGQFPERRPWPAVPGRVGTAPALTAAGRSGRRRRRLPFPGVGPVGTRRTAPRCPAPAPALAVPQAAGALAALGGWRCSCWPAGSGAANAGPTLCARPPWWPSPPCTCCAGQRHQRRHSTGRRRFLWLRRDSFRAGSDAPPVGRPSLAWLAWP